MSSETENTKRIAKNTLMLYMSMLVTMFVSFYTTRVILQALGEDDYGLLGLVGAIIGMMGIITSLLAGGTSRFITIALGKDNREELKNTFSSSLTIHLALAAIIFFIGELFGPGMVDNLNIASERLSAAHCVFQFSLISAVIGIIQSPFHGTIVAHEKMSVYACLNVFDVIAKLLIAYLLLAVNVDKLKLYSSFYFCVSLLIALIYYFYCKINFDECKGIKIKADWNLYKEILNYSGWNTCGAVANTMNAQGITILLNMFGTAVIAARGIAGSISNVVYNFVANFQTAVRPQVFKLYSVNDLFGMNNLVIRTSKFSSYLTGFIGIPLFIEMDYVLNLWLGQVPLYTTTFARLSLIQGLIQAIDLPIGTGIHAVGKMKLPNITSSFIYMAILPLSFVAIKLGASPTVTYVIIICVYPMAFFMDLYILNRYTKFPVSKYLAKEILPSIIFITITYFITDKVINNLLLPSFMRVVCTTIISSAIFLSLVYIGGLTDGERGYIVANLKRKVGLIWKK